MSLVRRGCSSPMPRTGVVSIFKNVRQGQHLHEPRSGIPVQYRARKEAAEILNCLSGLAE
jgi:hypothetical protein